MRPERRNASIYRAILMTALPVERQMVLQHLQHVEETRNRQGTIYWQGTFRGKRQMWRVAVAQIGMGGEGAAAETERAMSLFDPEVALFVGIAGGLKDVRIGDVVAASKVYNYERGKVADLFQPRPEVWYPSYAMQQRVNVDACENNWLKRLGEGCPTSAPHVLVGALAAGSKVISSTRSLLYQFLQANYGDALAVEMEGHGFFQALYAHPRTQALIIRGISDLIEGKAQADASGSQALAARHAAAFAFEVLANWQDPNAFSSADYGRLSRRFLITAAIGAVVIGAGATIEFVRKEVLRLTSFSPVYQLASPGGSFNSLEYSPDSTLLAAARYHIAQIISVSTGAPLVTYTHHTDHVNAISWARDGERVATASTDKTAQVWHARNAKQLLIYRGHSDTVTGVAWSPDRTKVASSSHDQTVQVWDPVSGATLATCRGHEAKVWWVAWSPDGKLLVSGDDLGIALIWDASKGTLIGAPYTGHRGRILTVRWSPDGTSVASAGDDAKVRIWSPKTKQDITVCQGHTATIQDVSWSPDNTHLISGSIDGTFRIWKVGSQQPSETYQPSSRAYRIYSTVYSRGGNQIAVGDDREDGTDCTLLIWQENWLV